MQRFFSLVAIAAIGMTTIGAGIALAAEMEIIPGVADNGDPELTIDVWDFDPDTPIYVVPCDVPESGDDADVTTDSCDTSEVVATRTDADGTASFSVTWTIPEEGVAVYVGDEMAKNQVAQVLTRKLVGAETEAPAVEVLGTNVTQEDLADTGPRETMLLLMIAATLIALGGFSTSLAHRVGLETRQP